jgi:Glycosyltransferase family 9 (heptosyltransferase)
MHVIELKKDGATLAAGRYIVEDINAGVYMLANQKVRPTVEYVRTLPSSQKTRNASLVIGNLGFGDALMLTPVLREMKRRNPHTEIHLGCNANVRQVFLGLPYVDGFVDEPVREGVAADFESVYCLEHAVDDGDESGIHMTDAFAKRCLWVEDGEWPKDRKPDLILSGDEREWAKSSFPRNKGKRRLGIQVSAGARNRTYPMSKFSPELDKLVKDGWEVALLGSPGEFRGDKLNPGIRDMSRFGLTWRQTVAFMDTCDCILAPDSSLMHAAGTLDIPCVALFGAFNYHTRTKYYLSVFALHGDGACPMAPCHWSHHSGIPVFPRGGPCEQSGLCDELVSIDPERIRAKINQLAPVAAV